MKVLFAVSNESISNSIVKKYQKEYKEIISYKNVYYFNAILKELQKDKTYDRVVISEDLEQFTNSDYEQMDKFIFEKLDGISDEAANTTGADIPILLICSERRSPGEAILVKLFGIGIYNAIMGKDRSIDEVCKLINRPRTKKEAKIYYRIEAEDVNYQAENENDVSEIEVQNILAHYKRLGKNEERYVESFNNIASQYNDVQLRLISKYLPLNVRAVLEEQSPKYQQIMSFNNSISNDIRYGKRNVQTEEKGTSEKLLGDAKSKLSQPVVVPQNIKKEGTKKLTRVVKINFDENNNTKPKETVTQTQERIQPQVTEKFKPQVTERIQPQVTERIQPQEIENNIVNETIEEEPKKRRGRPRKINVEEEINIEQEVVKKKRGRPRKNIQEDVNDDILPGFEENNDTMLSGFEEETDDAILPGFEEEEANNTILPEFEEEANDTVLPGFEEENNDTMLPGFEDNEIDNKPINTTSSYARKNEESNLFGRFGETKSRATTEFNTNNRNIFNEDIDNINDTIDLNNLLSEDKKIVTFVGTTKNGTSFIVNNVAEKLSSLGIDVAIFDATQNKNSYYIYTKNEEELRKKAAQSVVNLKNGIADGIKVNRNLTVYSSIPDSDETLTPEVKILETLAKYHKIILIDCDFSTPLGYFKNAQEIYLVQSMDILTIQPLTVFLDKLKAKNILEESKLRIVLNKYVKLRGVNEKTIIGGMAYYNNPEMSIMEELFDRNIIKYITVPFEDDTYIKYLEGIVECDISIKGYSKTFKQVLDQLANMVYPIYGKKEKYVPNKINYGNNFSSSMNNTLNKMKQRY